MRIYEIARESGVTSVEVLKAAEAAGIEASNAISSVDADEAAALKAAVSKDAGAARVAKRAEKRNVAAELNAKFWASIARADRRTGEVRGSEDGGFGPGKSRVSRSGKGDDPHGAWCQAEGCRSG